MSLPWTVEARPDTRMTNGRLGLWLFIASDAMFMGALFSTWVFLRTAADAWPADGGALPLGTAGFTTVFLCAACIYAMKAHRQNSRVMLVLSTVMGALAFVLMTVEQIEVTAAGGTVASDNFYATYAVLSGAIRVHVAGAVLYGLWLLVVNGGMLRVDPARYANRVAGLAIYWYYVAIIWGIAFVMFHVL